MQDLNDKITGSTLTAAEWDQVPSEIQNVIEGLGQTLSAGDLNQLGKSIAGYVANGTFYTDSGTADAYVLSVIGSKQSPTAYTDGLEVEFVVGNTNTGASTVNVASLGVKSIILESGVATPAGALVVGINYKLRFDTTDDAFHLLTTTNRAIKGSPTAVNASMVGYAFSEDGDTGLFAEGGTTSSGSDIVLRSDGIDIGKFTTSDKSLVATGYTKLPSGAILQWGEFTQSDNGGTVAFTFNLPLTMPNATLQAFLTIGNNNSVTAINASVESLSATQVSGFTAGPTSSRKYRIFAIGH